jgi:hypothetical protein
LLSGCAAAGFPGTGLRRVFWRPPSVRGWVACKTREPLGFFFNSFFFAIDIFAKSKLYRFSGKKIYLIDQACFNGSI